MEENENIRGTLSTGTTDIYAYRDKNDHRNRPAARIKLRQWRRKRQRTNSQHTPLKSSQMRLSDCLMLKKLEIDGEERLQHGVLYPLEKSLYCRVWTVRSQVLPPVDSAYLQLINNGNPNSND